MKIDDNGIVREMTDEEFAQLTAEDAEPVEETEVENYESENSKTD